jgi:predicted transcriptional regulator of viral defense system
MFSETQRERALRLLGRNVLLTAGEATDHGIHRQVLSRLVGEGTVERVGRGRYRLADLPMSQWHGLALVAGASPRGVVCLVSALSFHGIGTQMPSRVWLAVPRNVRKPSLTWPRVRVFRFGGASMTDGVEVHTVEAVPVQVFNPAKTVADLFKYRNKVRLDVCMEALREVLRDRRATVDELLRFARVCRVDRIMRPYLEAVLA